MSFTGISTILPVHLNVSDPREVHDLKRAVRSVLEQDCSLPVEVLMVDDGSPEPLEECPELRDIFQSDRVSHIRLSRNQGLVFALNVGLTRARYNLVARIDADDYWRPSKLEKQVRVFESDPDVTIVGTAMRLVHTDPALDCDHVRGSSWQDVLNFFASTGCPFPHGSILARKDIFLLLTGYPHDPDFRVCEDFALWGGWVRFFKAAMLEQVLFEYTVSDTQASNRHAEQQQAASRLVHAKFLSLKNHEAIPDAVAQIARGLGISLIEAGKLLFIAWQYYDYILADADLYKPLSVLLPDRQVHPYHDVVNLVADRFFYFHKGSEWDRSLSAHARCVHDASDIEPLLT